jgi:hypothetical protein
VSRPSVAAQEPGVLVELWRVTEPDGTNPEVWLAQHAARQ